MKKIIITGATSGIGKALAMLCAEKGYDVIACGRNQQTLDEMKSHRNISVKRFDVSSIDSVTEALSEQQPDIVVLNAGVCEYVDVEQFEAAMFERVFAANFFGLVNSIEALLPNLKKGSQIVIVDSLALLLPFTRSQAYGASKAAAHYLAKSLQVDLAAKGILVQSVSPGFVETPLTDKNDFEMPMKISVEQAAIDFLNGIEKKRSSIYFPTLFSGILRGLSHLPNRLKVGLCKRMKFKQMEH